MMNQPLHEKWKSYWKIKSPVALRCVAWKINDFGYLMEHLYGRDGIAYEDYEYQLPKEKIEQRNADKILRPYPSDKVCD